jgi:hypothetical protein
MTTTKEHVALLERWKKGEQLHALSAASGIKRSKLRRVLIAAAGGKDAFRALRAQGAGGRAEPFGGKRRTAGAPSIDDSQVKHVKSSKRWTCRREWEPRIVTIKGKDKDGRRVEGKHAWRELKAMIFISPKGNEYVQALGTEKADLIVTPAGLPPVRLRKYATSAVARRAKEVEKERERGEAALKRISARKQARRAERKAKKAKRAEAEQVTKSKKRRGGR